MKNLIKPFFACAIACTFVIGTPANSAGGDKKKPAGKGAGKGAGKRPEGGKRGRGKGGDFIKSLDKNNDHSISKEEAGERWARMSKLDKDGDDKISPKELMAGRPNGAPKKGGDKPEGKGKPDTPGKPREGKRPDFNPGEMFKRADGNDDGKISKEEAGERWERLGRMDKDQDGSVSQKEWEAGMAAMRKGGGGRSGQKEGAERFKNADKNSDGKLSEDEVPAEAWARIGKFDKDGDKAVSKEEIAAGVKAAGGGDRKGGPKGMKRQGRMGESTGGPDAIFAKMDKNEDNKLSKDEVPAEMWAKLSQADEDADGTVSKSELGKVYEKRAANAGKKKDAKK